MKTENVINSQRLVIDASIGVKWFSLEEQTEAARLVLKKILSQDIIAYVPDLFFYEVGNALWKAKKMDSQRIIRALDDLFDLSIETTPLDRNLMKSTVTFMTTYDITFYDAVYASLAYILNAPLLTADPTDHKKVREVLVKEL